MASFLSLKTFTDKRGNLTVIEKIIPFQIKRIFYIYGVDNSKRGNHRHKKTIQAAICIKGSCIISIDDNERKEDFFLNDPSKCLILEPKDFHCMHSFTKNAILMVLASEYYNPGDYIFDPYN